MEPLHQRSPEWAQVLELRARLAFVMEKAKGFEAGYTQPTRQPVAEPRLATRAEKALAAGPSRRHFY